LYWRFLKSALPSAREPKVRFGRDLVLPRVWPITRNWDRPILGEAGRVLTGEFLRRGPPKSYHQQRKDPNRHEHPCPECELRAPNVRSARWREGVPSYIMPVRTGSRSMAEARPDWVGRRLAAILAADVARLLAAHGPRRGRYRPTPSNIASYLCPRGKTRRSPREDHGGRRAA